LYLIAKNEFTKEIEIKLISLIKKEAWKNS